MPARLFTIGHSTHSLAEFVGLLTRHGVRALADIRRFPGSRKYPHFHRESLAETLPRSGIEYFWLEALGGRRPASHAGESPNLGLRNESFRNYADYMATEAFCLGVNELLALAESRPTAYMCSESVFWRCHRRLVSDYLLTHGHQVEHIMPTGELRPHTLTPGAKVVAGTVIYPPPEADQGQRLFDC